MKTITIDKRKTLNGVAGQYLWEQRLENFGGFVLIENDIAVGHCDALGSYPAIQPGRVAPGVYAVGERGGVFVATGGKGWVTGALSWTPVATEAADFVMVDQCDCDQRADDLEAELYRTEVRQ